MPKITEFGGGESTVELNTIVDAQEVMVPPPFPSRRFSRDVNGMHLKVCFAKVRRE